jgi:hypothetical protein
MSDSFWNNYNPPDSFRCRCATRSSASSGSHQAPGHCGPEDDHADQATNGPGICVMASAPHSREGRGKQDEGKR